MAGQPHGPDPQRVDDAITGVLATMKQIFHEQLQATAGRDDGVRPQFALLCTVDPRNGARQSHGLGVVIVVPSHFDDEADKEKIAIMTRTIAVAGEAVAAVVCMDTYMAVDDAAKDYEKRGILPRDNPKSLEAMFVAVERRGQQAQLEQHVYRRLSDGIAFDDSVVRKIPSSSWGGRFANILPPRPVPAATVAFMREMIKAGAFGDLKWQAI